MLNQKLSKADFLGRGLSFPVTFQRGEVNDDGEVTRQGEIEMVEGEIDIQQGLQIILGTRPNERPMLPDFGTSLDDFLFGPLDASTISLMQDTVQTALMRFEPRIIVEEVLVSTDSVEEGIVTIGVNYRIRKTNSRFNLVYPFYLEEGTDVNL